MTSQSATEREVFDDAAERAADAEATADITQMGGELVEVTPLQNWQISHAGHVAGPGETLSVPAALAEEWRRRGLIA